LNNSGKKPDFPFVVMFPLIVRYAAAGVVGWDPLFAAGWGRIAPPACFGTIGFRRMMR